MSNRTEQEKHNVYLTVNVILITLFFYLFIEYLVFNGMLQSINLSNSIANKAISYINEHFNYQFKISLFFHILFTSLLIAYAFIHKSNVNLTKKTRKHYQLLSLLTNTVFIFGFIHSSFYDLYIYPIFALVNIPITSKAFSRSRKLQDERFFNGVSDIESDFYFSFNTDQGQLTIHKPQRNIYIDGGPGSGKSVSLIKPIIYQTVEQGGSGVIYDFEGDPLKEENPILTKTAYSALKKINHLDRFAFINFTDLTKTYRTNILKYINNKAEIIQLATALMKNLNDDWKEKVDFWGQNAITYVSAIITRLFNSEEYRQKGYFTLPHVIALTLTDGNYVIPWLKADKEVSKDASMIITAFDRGAEGQLAGAVGSAQGPIKELNFSNISYVLTEIEAYNNVIDLDITNKMNRKILCLGNSSRLNEAITPVLSCITYVIMNNMNQPGKEKSIFCFDEFPTINLYGIDSFIAEARKHRISTILALQDFEQSKRDYGEKSANILRTSSGNQFFGSTGNVRSAKELAESLGEIKIARTSYTKNEGAGSETESLQKERVLQTRDITSQPTGHFLCKIADGNPPYSFTQFKEFKEKEVDHIEPFNLPHGHTLEDYYSNKKGVYSAMETFSEYIHNQVSQDVENMLSEFMNQKKQHIQQQEQQKQPKQQFNNNEGEGFDDSLTS